MIVLNTPIGRFSPFLAAQIFSPLILHSVFHPFNRLYIICKWFILHFLFITLGLNVFMVIIVLDVIFWLNRWEIRVGGWNLQKCKLFYVAFFDDFWWFVSIYCDFVLISGYLLRICVDFCVFIVNLIYLWTFMKYFLRFRSIWSYMLDLLWIVWIYTDLWVCHAIWWIYYDSCEYKFIWLVCFVKFIFFLHIWYFCYLLCNFCYVCEIVLVAILLCGLTCRYAYTSGTVT